MHSPAGVAAQRLNFQPPFALRTMKRPACFTEWQVLG